MRRSSRCCCLPSARSWHDQGWREVGWHDQEVGVNRRQFVSSIGALTIPASVAVAAPEPLGSPRARVSINGRWERHVNGLLLDHVEVPSSLRPSGFYQLKRTFLLPK